jgi:hypothetical protein
MAETRFSFAAVAILWDVLQKHDGLSAPAGFPPLKVGEEKIRKNLGCPSAG